MGWKNKVSCVECKGRGLCGRPHCPILSRFESMKSHGLRELGDSVFGASPPAVFVGTHDYPRVSTGPMVPPLVEMDDALKYDRPDRWLDLSIQDIINIRTALVRGRSGMRVTDARWPTRNLEKTQEIALSDMPVDTEMKFMRPIKGELRFDGVLMPMAPSGEIKSMRITENPTVPRKVDRLVSDTDARAYNAVEELHASDISPYHITRLLSVGLLGEKRRRRLVPTRWSITAVDDMLGKQLKERVRDLPVIDTVQLYSGERFGNHFEVLLIPREFAFELIEIWMPRSAWSGNTERSWVCADHEVYIAKRGYSPLGGGYYAARVSILEHMRTMNRQAMILALREITSDYWAPLGVWVVREVARMTMNSRPLIFETVEEALSDAALRIHTPRKEWYPSSRIFSDLLAQRKLADFFK